MAWDEPYLPRDPPPRFVRALAGFLVSFFVAGVVAVVTVPVPESVDAPFLLVPVATPDAIRSPSAGMVSEVAVRPGAVVDAGAHLLTLRSDELGDRASEVAELRLRTENADHRLALLLSAHAAALRASESAGRALTARTNWLLQNVTLRQAEEKTAAARVEQSRRLVEAGAEPIEHLRAEEDARAAAAAATADARAALAANQAAIAQQSAMTEQQRAENADAEAVFRAAQKADAQRLAQLLEAPGTTEGDALRVTAPCDGVVLRLGFGDAGAIVARGDPLVTLSCADVALEVQLTLTEAGVVRLAPGQKVKLYFDAFPFQRHGVKWAEVERVDPVVSMVDGMTRSTASARLLDGTFVIAGRKQAVLPGMSGRAEVVVERRTAIGHLLASLEGPAALLADAPPEP